jgi:hypothetical protein
MGRRLEGDWAGALANARATFIPDITNAYTNASRRALKHAAARLDDRGRAQRHVHRHVDLDPLLLDRRELLGEIALAHRMVEVAPERFLIGQVDDQRVREAVVGCPRLRPIVKRCTPRL